MQVCNILRYSTISEKPIKLKKGEKEKDKKIDNILYYHVPKMCCHINQCDASVQYFAILQILHDFRENSETKNMFTLTPICKGKCCSMM